MLRVLSPVVRLSRRFTKSTLRYSHGGYGSQGSVPGENLPINFKWSKAKFTVIWTLFFGIPLGAPFLILRHQLLRK